MGRPKVSERRASEPAAAGGRRAPFYGWFVVAAGFTVTFVGFGCVYSFSAFIPVLLTEFSGSRGSVALAFSIASFLYFGLGGISGLLADRYGSRLLAAVGMALVGAGLAAASFATSLTQVAAAYALGVGLGVGCAYVPAMGAVQRWFVRHRGFASGLASSGIGVGTLVVPPVTALLIGTIGWRETYLVLGIAAAAIGIGAALLIENDPRDRGLGPDGDPIEPQATQARAGGLAGGLAIAEAIRSRGFIGLYIACLTCAFGVFVPFVHLVPYAIDHGIKAGSAVLLVSAIGVGSTAGRFCLGGVADRFGRKRSLVAMFVGMALSLCAWAISTGFWPLAGFAFVFGIAYGGWVALLPAVVMDYFGGRNVSGLIGLLYTSAGIGTLIGPSVAGFAFDMTGSYTVPILASAAGNVIAALVMAFVATPPRAVLADRIG